MLLQQRGWIEENHEKGQYSKFESSKHEADLLTKNYCATAGMQYFTEKV